MGQAALKYDDLDELDQVPIPEGGIATFLTAETGSWADDDDDVPPKGITNVVKIADKLAEYGRNEDEYMVHAAEGETVIPMEVFKQNPALKDKLFAEMRIMGIEPERYIVGNELNSINPITGQPEFFLKKLFRGLKKIVKKVLPVVATIVLSAIPGVGPVLASAIVSGAQTAIEGGSLKDSLKAAAIGGISSFAAGKIGNKFNWAENSAKQMATQAAINTTLSGGKPKDILKSAALSAAVAKGTDFVSDRFAPAGAEATATLDPAYAEQLAKTDPAQLARLQQLEGVTVPSLVEATPDAAPVTVTETATADAARGEVAPTVADVTQGGATAGVQGPATDPLAGLGDASLNVFPEAEQLSTDIDKSLAESAEDRYLRSLRREAGLAESGTRAPGTTVTPTAGEALSMADLRAPGIGESIKTIFTGTGAPGGRLDALKDLFLPSINRNKVADYLKSINAPATDEAVSAFIKKNADDLNFDFIRRFAPAGVGLLAASQLGAEEVDPIDITDRTTGLDLIRENPEAYRIFDEDRTYIPPRFTITRAAGANFGAPAFRPTPIDLPPLGVAEGGEIMNFPRMNGPIEGPGTETSDDIPAMLSDGEFVFTAKAVRGAGKGSREDGMRNMYKMMRQFEARV